MPKVQSRIIKGKRDKLNLSIVYPRKSGLTYNIVYVTSPSFRGVPLLLFCVVVQPFRLDVTILFMKRPQDAPFRGWGCKHKFARNRSREVRNFAI